MGSLTSLMDLTPESQQMLRRLVEQELSYRPRPDRPLQPGRYRWNVDGPLPRTASEAEVELIEALRDARVAEVAWGSVPHRVLPTVLGLSLYRQALDRIVQGGREGIPLTTAIKVAHAVQWARRALYELPDAELDGLPRQVRVELEDAVRALRTAERLLGGEGDDQS